MSVPFGRRVLRPPAPGTYRGPDRRNIIHRTARPFDAWWVSATAVGVVAAPLFAAAFMIGSVLGFSAWETGIGDAALIGYGAAALLLGLRWRFVGDALCIPLAAAAAVVGLGLVPATIHHGLNPTPIVGLRLASGIALMFLTLWALRSEEVRSDLRPVRFVTLTFIGVGLIAAVLSVWPVRTIWAGTIAGVRPWSLAEAFAELAVAAVAIREGIRRQRRILVAVGATVIVAATTTVLRVAHPDGVLLDLSALLLLAGAVVLVVTVAGELQSAVSAVVARDLRGTRRWEEAEAELEEMRKTVLGRRHDVRNILNSLDGGLHLLASHRQSMSEPDLDRTLGAVRQEVQVLQMTFGDIADHHSYDLSALLHGIIDVHLGTNSVSAEIEPTLIVHGRPDRVARAVDNLLVNVAVHAPGSTAAVAARRLCDEGLVEVAVSDDGSGLPDHERALACNRGWRSNRSMDRPGSGLGLAQVKELIAAEGGEVHLEPTRLVATASTGQGLTVRLRIPLRPTS
jgi:signal transduction histidine kinase